MFHVHDNDFFLVQIRFAFVKGAKYDEKSWKLVKALWLDFVELKGEIVASVNKPSLLTRALPRVE
jgi:hypothetical protein